MPENSQNDYLVETRNLVKYYPIRGGVFLKEVAAVKAVDDVSLTIRSGETMGLVGESGCGKTTFGRAILRLEEPTAGEVIFKGRNLLACDAK
ncbi:MAG: ABC transporter ATP-binding protein, partial [Desulfobacterales bacterium]